MSPSMATLGQIGLLPRPLPQNGWVQTRANWDWACSVPRRVALVKLTDHEGILVRVSVLRYIIIVGCLASFEFV